MSTAVLQQNFLSTDQSFFENHSQHWKRPAHMWSPFVTTASDGPRRIRILDEPRIVVELTATKSRDLSNSAKFLVEIGERLKELLALEAGWDGYGAHSIDKRAIKPAISLCFDGYQRCSIPTISPSPDGGISLIWDVDGRELDVTVYSDSKCWLFFDGDAQTGSDECEFEADLSTTSTFLSEKLICK